MKLLVRRHQRRSIFGGMVFVLDVRGEFSRGERRSIATYRLGHAILYSRAELLDPGHGLVGLLSRLSFNLMNTSLSLDELTAGKRIECTSVVEMLAVEDKITAAFATFKTIMEAARQFGGEELVKR